MMSLLGSLAGVVVGLVVIGIVAWIMFKAGMFD